MKVKLGETILRINISFAAAVTLTLILDESGLCAAALFCCIIHELGHVACLLILGEKPQLIELSFYGIKLKRHNVSELKSFEETMIYMSGPTANFALSALLFICGTGDGMRTAAAISACVGLFNLLPCQPLDGGNVLCCFLNRRMGEERCAKTCFCVSCATLAPMVAAGVTLLLKSGNITLLAVSLYLAAILATDRKEKRVNI